MRTLPNLSLTAGVVVFVLGAFARLLAGRLATISTPFSLSPYPDVFDQAQYEAIRDVSNLVMFAGVLVGVVGWNALLRAEPPQPEDGSVAN